MKLYLKTFFLVGISVGVLTHFVTQESMPWWPDTVVMGATFGTLAAFSVFQHHRSNRFMWNALKRTFRRS